MLVFPSFCSLSVFFSSLFFSLLFSECFSGCNHIVSISSLCLSLAFSGEIGGDEKGEGWALVLLDIGRDAALLFLIGDSTSIGLGWQASTPTVYVEEILFKNISAAVDDVGGDVGGDGSTSGRSSVV